jgi:hypothetical protein
MARHPAAADEREDVNALQALCYFDTCDGGDFIRDAIGLELDGIEAARDEAAPGLADFADRISGRDSPGSSRSSFACRDAYS